MNKIQRAKKIQLFLVVYDSRTDARLDDILEEPCKGDTTKQSSCAVLIYMQILIRVERGRG